MYSPTHGYLKVGGQTWRQHIPVVGLSQPVGNALDYSEGEKERENQPPKYSLALGLSKRPSAGGLATHTHRGASMYTCAHTHTFKHTHARTDLFSLNPLYKKGRGAHNQSYALYSV